MQGWTIPRCFEGGTVAVLASGPSMSQRMADAVHVAGVPAIAINTTYRLAPWAWMVYAADAEWWAHSSNAAALKIDGLRVSVGAKFGGPLRDVHVLRNAGVVGYSDEQDCVHTLGNSGAQALQIAVKTGAKRVLLCGFDFHGGHWHGEHPSPLRATIQETYPKWSSRLAALAPLLHARGVDVVNVTPNSALKAFRMADLDAELVAVRPGLCGAL